MNTKNDKSNEYFNACRNYTSSKIQITIKSEIMDLINKLPKAAYNYPIP